MRIVDLVPISSEHEKKKNLGNYAFQITRAVKGENASK